MMPSIPQLLIVLVIVVLIFGAKRLRNLGGDLGSAVKGFKSAMKDDDKLDKDNAQLDDNTAQAAEKTESVTQNDKV